MPSIRLMNTQRSKGLNGNSSWKRLGKDIEEVREIGKGEKVEKAGYKQKRATTNFVH